MKNERLYRYFAALAIPLAVACTGGNEDKIGITEIPQSTHQETPTTRKTGMELLKEIAKEYGGAVVVTIEYYNPDIDVIVKFDRVDIADDQKSELDSSAVRLNIASAAKIGRPLDAVFPATSCQGKYKLSLSFDNGTTFEDVQIPDYETGVSSDNFRLPPDKCYSIIGMNLADIKQ